MEPGWLTAGAACVGGVAALYAAINGSRTLARARKDSRDRSRPMLAAELRRIPYVRGSQTMVIRNFGPTIAWNVQVTFDPEIPDPDPAEASRSLTPFLKRRYENPISVITPGMELANLWFVGQSGPDGKWVNVEPTPDRVTVRIVYEAADGTPYGDEFVLDVQLIKMETEMSPSTAPEAQLREGVKAVRGIQESVAAIAESAGG